MTQWMIHSTDSSDAPWPSCCDAMAHMWRKEAAVMQLMNHVLSSSV